MKYTYAMLEALKCKPFEQAVMLENMENTLEKGALGTVQQL